MGDKHLLVNKWREHSAITVKNKAKLQCYQSLQLVSRTHCEPISAALVQMVMTTGPLDRQQHDKPHKGNVLAAGGYSPFLSLSLLTVFHLNVPITAVIMR